MQDEPFSRTIHRVLVLNPVLSISSPGFQKSSPGFVKYESGFFSSPGPGFSRVRIFFESESVSESESGPGFEVCLKHHHPKKVWTSHILGTYLYFKYFSVRGKLRRDHNKMLNNSDIKSSNSVILHYIIYQSSKVAAYRIWCIILYNGQLYKKN